jgi:MFS family permease
MTPWWTQQTAGWIGAIAGSANGILGGVIGTVAGIYGQRGKGKRLVYALVAVALVGGAASLAVGLFALMTGQPYMVWYPLVLIGGMDTLLFSVLTPVIRRVYRQAEARRMEAEELRRT